MRGGAGIHPKSQDRALSSRGQTQRMGLIPKCCGYDTGLSLRVGYDAGQRAGTGHVHPEVMPLPATALILPLWVFHSPKDKHEPPPCPHSLSCGRLTLGHEGAMQRPSETPTRGVAGDAGSGPPLSSTSCVPGS